MYTYNRIRDLREDADKTQAEIAKYLNVGTTTYRRWETGEREIPLHIIIKLAKKYKVSLDYIAGLTNNPNTNYTKIKNNININNGTANMK
ncbi:helix-turn-helix transcriptional regulator [Ruminococcus sp.]|uniref:helix-turn-helix domain-containing protein n=1 Tax=Ruminococcus sp. TaxID=41978 RepID=UPI00307D5E75